MLSIGMNTNIIHYTIYYTLDLNSTNHQTFSMEQKANDVPFPLCCIYFRFISLVSAAINRASTYY